MIKNRPDWPILHKFLVRRAGIEPARPQWPRDFKSLASTNSAIRACLYYITMSANHAICYDYSMKTCSKCSVEKPLTDYFMRDKSSGRLHAQCKTCYKAHRTTYAADHYTKYKNLYKERAKQRRQMLKKEFRQNMLAFLVNKQCVICGEDDIRTFELDHIDPATKLFSISQAVRLGYGWDDVLAELEKCRVLCANCHKRHTATQANWYKKI